MTCATVALVATGAVMADTRAASAYVVGTISALGATNTMTWTVATIATVCSRISEAANVVISVRAAASRPPFSSFWQKSYIEILLFSSRIC